jgi:hypothetical protein
VQSAGGDVAATGDLVFHELSQAKNSAVVRVAKTSNSRAPKTSLRARKRVLMAGVRAREVPASVVTNIATSKASMDGTDA